MRINLGSGLTHFPGADWINCDRHGDVDVTCDAYPLPFDTDYADEIWAIHLLEHLHRSTVNLTLYEWFRVLKPGGKLVLEMPCLDKIARHIVNGEENMRLTLMGLYGDPRDQKPDMMHQWGWGTREILEVLSGVNFTEVQILEPVFHWPARDFRVEARKPS